MIKDSMINVLISPLSFFLNPSSFSSVAGEVGFEPTDGGSKGRCLTTWRLPSKLEYEGKKMR